MPVQQKEFLACGGAGHPPSDSLADPRVALAWEIARRSGSVRLRLTGSSMMPAILPHDEVLVRSCVIDELACGDVVLFVANGRFFAHRVRGRLAGGLVTQGDSLPAADPIVPAASVVGRVERVLRRGRVVGRGEAPSAVLRVFAGAFRRWAGLARLVSAMALLRARGLA